MVQVLYEYSYILYVLSTSTVARSTEYSVRVRTTHINTSTVTVLSTVLVRYGVHTTEFSTFHLRVMNLSLLMNEP